MPLRRQVEQQRFEQAQLQAAADAVAVAAEARRAFFAAVAAQQLLSYFEQVKDAADASNELGRRMQQAIPQQRPSGVPQQHTVQAVLTGCTQETAVCAHAGEQTAATLVLAMSEATTLPSTVRPTYMGEAE